MKKLKLPAVIIALSFLLSACQSAAEVSADEKYIYYLDPTVTQLMPIAAGTDAPEEDADTDELIKYYLAAFAQPPEDVDAVVGFSDNVTFMSYELEYQVLKLYFDSNYAEMKPVRKALCNAALAKTMTQINGVSYISIYSGEQPLTDESGVPYGMISASDYASAISDVNNYESKEMVLYFAAEDGTQLVKEMHNVMVNISTSMERAVVEELIRGPQQSSNKAVIPSGTRLVSVSLTDGTCYLNFTDEINEPIEGIADTATIYALVNTLTELPNVARVQIMINSSQDVMFRDAISLEKAFERDYSYIKE